MAEELLLQGKVAIVTGSTRGNGRVIADLFSAQGSNVVVVGRSREQVEEVAEDLRIKHGTRPLGVTADITSSEDIGRMIGAITDEYGERIDILVNNAGFPIRDEL
jgi:NAD(P)-dependent dehydrogenase (short-subunit alcohol dehydrogenase family)